jgi:TnpA family transposase
MSNPRTSINDLKLQGSTNLKRAQSYASEKRTAKRAELEALFALIQERHAEALADVKKNGAVIFEDKSNARGMIYVVRKVNPALHIAQQCERQLVALAKLLTEEVDTGKKSVAQLLKETEHLVGAN